LFFYVYRIYFLNSFFNSRRWQLELSELSKESSNEAYTPSIKEFLEMLDVSSLIKTTLYTGFVKIAAMGIVALMHLS
jgi:hypothetical protein